MYAIRSYYVDPRQDEFACTIGLRPLRPRDDLLFELLFPHIIDKHIIPGSNDVETRSINMFGIQTAARNNFV